jgi:hypothetical protein
LINRARELEEDMHWIVKFIRYHFAGCTLNIPVRETEDTVVRKDSPTKNTSGMMDS